MVADDHLGAFGKLVEACLAVFADERLSRRLPEARPQLGEDQVACQERIAIEAIEAVARQGSTTAQGDDRQCFEIARRPLEIANKAPQRAAARFPDLDAQLAGGDAVSRFVEPTGVGRARRSSQHGRPVWRSPIGKGKCGRPKKGERAIATDALRGISLNVNLCLDAREPWRRPCVKLRRPLGFGKRAGDGWRHAGDVLAKKSPRLGDAGTTKEQFTPATLAQGVPDDEPEPDSSDADLAFRR